MIGKYRKYKSPQSTSIKHVTLIWKIVSILSTKTGFYKHTQGKLLEKIELQKEK